MTQDQEVHAMHAFRLLASMVSSMAGMRSSSDWMNTLKQAVDGPSYLLHKAGALVNCH